MVLSKRDEFMIGLVEVTCAGTFGNVTQKVQLEAFRFLRKKYNMTEEELDIILQDLTAYTKKEVDLPVVLGYVNPLKD